jgi:prolyl-tRNA synthetase
MSKEITSRAENYSEWYNDLVLKGGLADYSAVRGCMVIKPYGFALWENMRDVLDKKFKDTGHVNAYFPLFVPKSLFEAEEKNAEGFAKECAVVTHYRLKTDPENPGKANGGSGSEIGRRTGSASNFRSHHLEYV